MQKKRVGVITFHNYDNYGAILQSYALQKKLQEIGTQPEIIDYRCDYISNPFRLVNLKKKGLFNYIYGAIGHICYIPRRFKCNKFRKHMRYSQPVIQGKMQPVAGKYDIYIAGSDQIWDYKLTNFDTTYFLDFVKREKRNAAMPQVSVKIFRRKNTSRNTKNCFPILMKFWFVKTMGLTL